MNRATIKIPLLADIIFAPTSGSFAFATLFIPEKKASRIIFDKTRVN
jgi:hypothetical protein